MWSRYLSASHLIIIIYIYIHLSVYILLTCLIDICCTSNRKSNSLRWRNPGHRLKCISTTNVTCWNIEFMIFNLEVCSFMRRRSHKLPQGYIWCIKLNMQSCIQTYSMYISRSVSEPYAFCVNTWPSWWSWWALSSLHLISLPWRLGQGAESGSMPTYLRSSFIMFHQQLDLATSNI